MRALIRLMALVVVTSGMFLSATNAHAAIAPDITIHEVSNGICNQTNGQVTFRATINLGSYDAIWIRWPGHTVMTPPPATIAPYDSILTSNTRFTGTFTWTVPLPQNGFDPDYGFTSAVELYVTRYVPVLGYVKEVLDRAYVTVNCHVLGTSTFTFSN